MTQMANVSAEYVAGLTRDLAAACKKIIEHEQGLETAKARIQEVEKAFSEVFVLRAQVSSLEKHQDQLKRELAACEGSLHNSGNMVQDLNDLCKMTENERDDAQRAIDFMIEKRKEAVQEWAKGTGTNLDFECPGDRDILAWLFEQVCSLRAELTRRGIPLPWEPDTCGTDTQSMEV